MNSSPQIDALAAALAKAQGQITGALKDSANPFFKSKYADLASCWDACRKQLSENGLSVIQTSAVSDTGVVVVITTLAHSSGQWISGALPVKCKDDSPQAQGSGMTYARRYALAAIVGVAQIDDDAEAAQGRNTVDPRGDAAKHADPAVVNKAVSTMTDLLNADVEEDVKACHIADYHDTIKTKHDIYIAASDMLSASQRSGWKAYVKMAQDMARREPMAANGRR